MAEAKYLASNAFSLVGANYFWEGFDEFRDLAAEQYSDLDFSSIKLNEPEAESEQEEEVG